MGKGPGAVSFVQHSSSSSSSSAQPAVDHKPSEPPTLPSYRHHHTSCSTRWRPAYGSAVPHTLLSLHSTSTPPAGDQPKPAVSPISLKGPPAPAEARTKERLSPSQKPQAKRRTLKRPSTTAALVGTNGEGKKQVSVDSSSMPAPPPLSTHPGLKAVEPPVPLLRPSPPMAAEEGGGEWVETRRLLRKQCYLM